MLRVEKWRSVIFITLNKNKLKYINVKFDISRIKYPQLTKSIRVVIPLMEHRCRQHVCIHCSRSAEANWFSRNLISLHNSILYSKSQSVLIVKRYCFDEGFGWTYFELEKTFGYLKENCFNNYFIFCGIFVSKF